MCGVIGQFPVKGLDLSPYVVKDPSGGSSNGGEGLKHQQPHPHPDNSLEATTTTATTATATNDRKGASGLKSATERNPAPGTGGSRTSAGAGFAAGAPERPPASASLAELDAVAGDLSARAAGGVAGASLPNGGVPHGLGSSGWSAAEEEEDREGGAVVLDEELASPGVIGANVRDLFFFFFFLEGGGRHPLRCCKFFCFSLSCVFVVSVWRVVSRLVFFTYFFLLSKNCLRGIPSPPPPSLSGGWVGEYYLMQWCCRLWCFWFTRE